MRAEDLGITGSSCYYEEYEKLVGFGYRGLSLDDMVGHSRYEHRPGTWQCNYCGTSHWVKHEELQCKKCGGPRDV